MAFRTEQQTALRVREGGRNETIMMQTLVEVLIITYLTFGASLFILDIIFT